METVTQSGDRAPIERIVVAGAGAWGTTLALVALRAGHDVTLWVRNPADAEVLQADRRHPRSLTGVTLPDALAIETDPDVAFRDATAVIIAVPTQALAHFAESMRAHLAGKLLLVASKGITIAGTKLPTDVLSDLLDAPIVPISGPNLALEIAQGKPAASVVAHVDAAIAQRAQHLLHSSSFRVYTSSDPIGVQVGGALKNVIAIAAGIAEGLDVGDNAKASLMTRGIAEIARLGGAMGAQPGTFSGLSGLGDLMATCMSHLSRNVRVGLALAAGTSLDDIMAAQLETAEGIATTRAVLPLAASLGVELPIAAQVARVLFEGLAPADGIAALMGRDPRGE